MAQIFQTHKRSREHANEAHWETENVNFVQKKRFSSESVTQHYSELTVECTEMVTEMVIMINDDQCTVEDKRELKSENRGVFEAKYMGHSIKTPLQDIGMADVARFDSYWVLGQLDSLELLPRADKCRCKDQHEARQEFEDGVYWKGPRYEGQLVDGKWRGAGVVMFTDRAGCTGKWVADEDPMELPCNLVKLNYERC